MYRYKNYSMPIQYMQVQGVIFGPGKKCQEPLYG